LADAESAGSSHGRTGTIQPIASIGGGTSGGLADTTILGRGEGVTHDGRLRGGDSAEGSAGRSAVDGDLGGNKRPSPTNGHWRAADWLHCRDGKWRPVEPGTFPLAHGTPARVGRLRAYGNAIVPQAAAEVIGAYLAT
jgi:DNA (cytosine-5)-methyltransferase 1